MWGRQGCKIPNKRRGSTVAATTGPRAVGNEPGGDKARFRVGDQWQRAATKGSPQASADLGQEACQVPSADEMDPDSDGIKREP